MSTVPSPSPSLIWFSLPSCEAGKHVDLVFAVGALLDFLGGPERLGVVGLGDLVDVRPFELGLRRGRAGHDHAKNDRRCLA